MNEFNYPDYDDAIDAYSILSSAYYHNPSHVHGLICGYICFNQTFNPEEWLMAVIGKKMSSKSEDSEQWSKALSITMDLFDETIASLKSGDMDFQLYLPHDSEELTYRASAMTEWCAGFISIYRQVKEKMTFSEDALDVLEYMEQAIELDLRLDETDEEEGSFFEISEFIRLAAIMLYLELHKDEDVDKVLH